MSSKYINKSAKNNVNKSIRVIRNSSAVQPIVEATPKAASVPVSVPTSNTLIVKQPIYKPNNMNPNTLNSLKQQDKKVHTLGSNFMVAGNESDKNKLIYTYNGIDWISSANGNDIFDNYINTVAYNGSLWVAGSGSTNKLGYSSDGINWFASDSGSSLFDSAVFTVAWNGQIWVAGGNVTNKLAYSVDGIIWNPSINGSAIFGFVYSIAWNGSMWVAGGGDVLGYSYDGINWFEGTATNLNTVYSIIWNGIRWYCTVILSGEGDYFDILYSDDGITWQYIESLDSPKDLTSSIPDASSIVWNGSMFVVAFGENLGYSFNGLNWFVSNNGDILVSYSVSWNGQYWIVGGYGTNKLAYSVDGINWNPILDSANLIGNSGKGCLCIANRSVLPNVGQNLYKPIQEIRTATVSLIIGGTATATDITLSVVKTGRLVCMNISSFSINTGGSQTVSFLIPWADCIPTNNATYIQYAYNSFPGGGTQLLLQLNSSSNNLTYADYNGNSSVTINNWQTGQTNITYFTV